MTMTAVALLLLSGSQDPGFSMPMLEPCGAELVAVCRVPAAIDKAETERRLADGDDAVWAEDGVLYVVARRQAETVTLCCSIQSGMERVAGTEDIWALSARVESLERAVIETMIFADADNGPPLAQVPKWRGPMAPSAVETADIPEGWLIERTIESKPLDETRQLTIYRPESSAPMPVIYMADGESVSQFAMTLQPLIERGVLRPIMIVGLHSGPANPAPDTDTNLIRHQEYLVGWGDVMQPRWTGHDRFLREEVMPLAESLGASSRAEDRAVAGYSNGAAWALAMGVAHPEIFDKVMALSFGWGWGGLDEMLARARPGDWIGAGTMEPPFHEASEKAAETLAGKARRVTFDSRVSGHSPVMWNEQFPAATMWLFEPIDMATSAIPSQDGSIRR